jgi:hypothetical protein
MPRIKKIIKKRNYAKRETSRTREIIVQQLSLEEETTAIPYRTLLKFMPECAVAVEMFPDKVTPKIQYSLFDGPKHIWCW